MDRGNYAAPADSGGGDTAADRNALRRLAPNLGHSPNETERDKSELLRTLIEKAIITVPWDEYCTHLTLR